MEIIKELNLNGNPQIVPNGSLVYAKNLKLSLDGTYITNDDGFNNCFDTSDDSESLRAKLKVSNIVGTKVKVLCPFIEEFIEDDITITRNFNKQKIAGNINCPNEIVFFTYAEYTDYNKETSEAIRTGNESSIFRAVEFKDSNYFALFKVPTGWKYDGGTVIGTYTYNVYGHLIIGIAEYDADIDKQLLTIDLNDSYYNDSLNKYSCAPDVPIANLTLNNKVKGNPMPHGLYYFYIRYEVSNKLYTNWFPIGAPQYALSLDYKTFFNHTYATDSQGGNVKVTTGSFLVNTDKDSYYNFDFTINFNNTFSYIGFQIAYILQTDDTSVGRIWNNFLFNENELSKSFLFNGGYIEEVSIEDLTRDVLNVYNVKALTNYNSKLYAANFKETEYNVDLKQYADNIDTYLIKKVVDIDNIEKSSSKMITWTYTVNGSVCSKTVDGSVSSVRLKDFNNLLILLNSNTSWYYSAGEDNILTWLGEDTRVIFSTDELLLDPSLPKVKIAGVGEYNRFWRDYKNNYGFGVTTVGSQGGSGVVPVGELSKNKVSISKEETTKNYSTYNTDNVIRTLMPYEVYAFYVHYVRPDGSYTNGIPLENKNVFGFDDTIYKQIKDLNATELANYHLTDIATIEEIKDKYLYELYIKDYASQKEYFGVYLDNKGKKLFRTNSGVGNYNGTLYMLRLGVRFENIIYPPGYIGAFFSYEKINALSVYQGYVSDNISDNNSILIKANDSESANVRYDGALFIPHHKVTENGIESIANEPYYSYINNAAPVLSNASINFENSMLNRTGLHGGIVMNLSENNSDIYQPNVGIVGSIILFNKSIYSNEVKELIPFGPVTTSSTYGENSDAIVEVTNIDVDDTVVNYDMNYPSFLIQDKILTYKDSIFINEKGTVNIIRDNIIDPDTYYTNADYINRNYIWKFSNINLLALEVKKEPEEISGVVDNDNNTINTVVKPINASDLFKLSSCYLPKIHKSYTNYNENLNNPNIFTNVIRCSYPIRNESGINSWRVFDPSKYYVIDNSNGEIINIFGAAASFYIHTKNNLLVTTSNARLSADNTEINIINNNIFDVEPKELFSSELGYGGIKYQTCQLFSQFGYIWYDTDRRKLFRFDNGQLIDINSGITELIKRYKFEYCYINIDNNSNRIFFCFHDDSDTKILTVAYNTLNDKWLSIYDFEYDMSIHTANVVLFAIGSNYTIYSYNSGTYPCNYSSLQRVNDDLPSYIDSQSHSPIRYFCFDVIFNTAYTVPKVLDSITWAHDVIKQHILNENHPAQLELENSLIDNRVHDVDGLNIIVYSDSVDSGLLSLQHDKLNDVANPNNPNSYKYPYYNKGVWNLSYFRNNITTEVTDAEIQTLADTFNVDVNKLKKVYKVIDRNGNAIYRSSDLRSLIYGKYIVVRFIFKTDKRIKFDNLEFNLVRD